MKSCLEVALPPTDSATNWPLFWLAVGPSGACCISTGVTLDEWLEKIEREQPQTLQATEWADVHPQPWFNRAGSGKNARIRLFAAGLRYERKQGGETWYRVDKSEDWRFVDTA